MRRLQVISIAAIICIAGGPPSVLAQSKIESAARAELKTNKAVRVLIVTRPDPEQPSGGLSLSSPSSYVAGRLGSHAENVTPIGGLPVAAAEITSEGLNRLSEDPNVVLVTRDIPMPPTLIDSVPFIGGDKVHQLGFRGTNLAVAELDTGIQTNHPTLAGAIVGEACFSTVGSTIYHVSSLCPSRLDMSSLPGAAGQCPASIDGCEHGTHVAGILAGRNMVVGQRKFEGVAPAAKIVAIQVFSLFEGPADCSGADKCVLSFSSDQLRALDWVFKHKDDFGVAAVNMSLGTGYHDSTCDGTSPLTEVIERLRAKGVPTVVAAGNNSFNDGIAEPACISSAISVSATKKDGSLDISYSNVAKFVHLAAPGTGIISSLPGSRYGALSGTSMAAPHVAASMTLLRQEYPNDTVAQLEARLINGAPLTVDPRTGTKLPRLELTHAAPAGIVVAADAPPAAPPQPPAAAAPAAAAPPPPAAAPAASGSFIIKGAKTTQELQETLNQGCPELHCNLKAIADGYWKLEISPKGHADPRARAQFNMDATDAHKLLKSDPALKVFDERLTPAK